MKKIWTSLYKARKSLIFLGIIFLIGLLVGIIYFGKVNDTIVSNIQENLLNTHFNSNIQYHIIFFSIIIFFSFCGLGASIGLFLYFYEALSIGFVLATYFSVGGFSELIFAIIYVILYKFVYVLLLSLILIKSLNLSKNILGYFILKKDCDLKNMAITNFLIIIKYCFIAIIYDIFLEFFGNSILGIFNFLI